MVLMPILRGLARRLRSCLSGTRCPGLFLNWGTQTNQVVIDSMLASYEGVVAAQTGHISVHEAGAIEYTGHKVLTLPHEMGKFLPRCQTDLWRISMRVGNQEHMVYPGMVYISPD